MIVHEFETNPREYALDLVDEGYVDARKLLIDFLNYCTHEEVKECLDKNECAPRFMEDDDEEYTD